MRIVLVENLAEITNMDPFRSVQMSKAGPVTLFRGYFCRRVVFEDFDDDRPAKQEFEKRGNWQSVVSQAVVKRRDFRLLSVSRGEALFGVAPMKRPTSGTTLRCQFNEVPT